MNNNSKRFCSLVTSLAVMCSAELATCFRPFNQSVISSYAVSAENFEYELLNDGTAEITEWTGSAEGYVQIPDTINGVRITSIGEYAFMDCTEMTGVKLPVYLSDIGMGAFADCDKLYSVDIPDNVRTIGVQAFSNCPELAVVDFPYSLESVGDFAFNSCTSLKNVVLPESTGYIGMFAFADCNSLISITIPNSSCEISDINGRTIPDSTEIIGYSGSSAETYASNYGKIFREYKPSDTTATTTSATFTQTETKPVTTTTTTSSTAYKPAVTDFTWGVNNWNFQNSNRNSNDYSNIGDLVAPFGTTYHVNENTLLKIKHNVCGLSNIETEFIKYKKSDTWQGSCFGMVVTEIYSAMGLLDLKKFGGNNDVNSTKPSEEIISLINFFQQSQYFQSIGQKLRENQFSSHSSQAETVQAIEKEVGNIKNGGSFLNICYSIGTKNNTTGAYTQNYKCHAVLAYGVEKTEYTSDVTGKTYDRKILVADPNLFADPKRDPVAINSNACIYYSSKDYSWIIPEHTGKYINLDTIEVTYWNAGESTSHGSVNCFFTYDGNNTSGDASVSSADQYLPGMIVKNYDGVDYEIQEISNDSNQVVSSSSDGQSIKKYKPYGEDDTPENDLTDTYIMWGDDSTYCFVSDTSAHIDSCTDFRNIAVYSEIGSVKDFTIRPDGSFSFTGNNSSYKLKIVTNDGSCVTDWYAVQVSGKNASGNVQYSLCDNGYILSADNRLGKISVSANNDYLKTGLDFSTDYNSVFLYEIDEFTIGASVDTDGDGVYETLIAETDTLPEGDINLDGTFSIADAVMLQSYFSSSCSLDKYQYSIADLNNDSRVDIFDMVLMRKLVVEKLT